MVSIINRLARIALSHKDIRRAFMSGDAQIVTHLKTESGYNLTVWDRLFLGIGKLAFSSFLIPSSG